MITMREYMIDKMAHAMYEASGTGRFTDKIWRQAIAGDRYKFMQLAQAAFEAITDVDEVIKI